MKLKIKKTTNVFGKIQISGSKNACLPILTCSILTKKKICLSNVPNIKDVDYMIELLKQVGIKILTNISC